MGTFQKFGPNAHDFEVGRVPQKQVPTATCYSGNAQKSRPSWADHPPRGEIGRFLEEKPWRNWQLDKYKLHGKNSFTTNDKSKKSSFTLYNEPRWYYPKQFGRDYSRTGAGLNDYDTTFGAREREAAREGRQRRAFDVKNSELTSAAAAGAACRAASKAESLYM
jgi:hypothetical protein